MIPKFRGLSVESFNEEEWKYGYLIEDEGYSFIINQVIEANEQYITIGSWHPVNPATLGQSTGLKDKNGKEIFEGDVLEIQGIKMIVKFGSYKYLETSKNNGHILGVLHDGLGFYVECINAADPDNISPFEPETLKNSQIIGNVWKDGDLIDGKKTSEN